jgi:hypothetical protein
MNQFSRSVGALLLMAVASCNDPAAPVTSTLIGDNLVRLTSSASARELVGGSPVTLRTSLTNEGTETVTLHFRSTCQILPYIRDARGANVIPSEGGWGCGGALTQLSLGPGESVNREYIWTGSTAFPSELPLIPMPPGRYYFTVAVPAEEEELRSAPIELILR